MTREIEQDIENLRNYENNFLHNIVTKIRKEDNCWNFWTSSPNQKYGTLTVRNQGSNIGVTISAHRFSWLIYNGPIPDGLFVLHKCDNTKCVNPHHLWLGTQADNLEDMRNKKRDMFSRGYTPSAESRQRMSEAQKKRFLR